ncbi:MAG TPA: TonB-dependent receptor [Blastocatellia bacterium]|nr:TonB-dependent receptor [Blastocatellia bacterium]
MSWFVITGCHGSAQIQIGTVRGTVTDYAGAVLPGATMTLENSITGYRSAVTTDEHGAFAFNNVPFDVYLLRAQSVGFLPSAQTIRVRSNIPVTADAKLIASGASEAITVEAKQGLIEEDSTSTEIDLDESFIRRSAGSSRPGQLQRLIATTPGWMMEDNGLLHVRGVDDGIVYVVDGIPNISRLDAVSSGGFETEMVRSFNIITGNIPAEFGGRSGAVVSIQPRSGIDTPLTASLSAGAGSFNAAQIIFSAGGKVKSALGFFASGTASRTARFLDPPDPRNFNNRGGAGKLNARADWHPSVGDLLLFNLSVNATDFRVPNRLEQELAGQRQRQQLRDDSQSVSWQRVWSSATVSNFAYFRRFYQSRLFGSPFDTPLSAAQDRKHAHQGIIVSVTHLYRGHSFKIGVEASRVTPREFLTFAITDKEAAEKANISEAALSFDAEHPFVFRDREVRGQASWYAQDVFSPVKNLTINAGARYDHSSLLVSDQQISPRLGAVYYIPQTKTAVRGSFNRLYMPPQVENLLLADSEQARRLSPFRTDEGGGGASIRPEKVSAFEAGFSQDVRGLLKLDAAYWWRRFRNFDDPNVFFNTTIIFPNSVAKGFARGVDVRLDVPERMGWSAYLSFANARILQTGPINGGLFLTEEFIEIGPGTRFIPDHDQRNVVAFGIYYYHQRSGVWASFSGRHESGVPLEIDEDAVEELRTAVGADLVNFERGRMKPWTVFDFATGVDLFRDERVKASAQFEAENLFDRRFVYNFGNPFSGTHFGHPRMLGGRIKLTFH